MGMTSLQRLFKVELPLGASVILAGLRTATVTCVGVATIAAAIGAGGLGELIFRGVASSTTASSSPEPSPPPSSPSSPTALLALIESRLTIPRT